MPGDHDDLCVDLPLAHSRQRRQAIDAGQPDVEYDDVVDLPGEAIEARFSAVDRVDVVALVAQHTAQRAANARLIVNDQNGWHAGASYPGTLCLVFSTAAR